MSMHFFSGASFSAALFLRHHRRRIFWLAALFSALLAGWNEPVRAATLLPGFTETVIPGPNSGNWNEAVGITFDSANRMFVWERAGRIWIKDPADSGFSLLLDISDEVGGYEDYGLLGVALDPNFRVNGYIYLVYTVDRYHLLNFGTPGYNPNSNAYFDATIARLTRYTCNAAAAFRTVNLASRLILIGATKQTGFPMLSSTHGVGTVLFADDGSLLISCGDAASPTTVDIGGGAHASYAVQGRTDQIIQPKEDIGAYRSQLVDCLNGKIIRIDPATGNGLPSNPFYDPANPSSARSRVWALGLRNPFRMTLRPETGSHNPDDGRPGVLYIGEVGWDTWESLKVVTGPGQNCGWPVFEGLSLLSGYATSSVTNYDAPNPLYPGGSCRQYFSFTDLLKEDTLDVAGQPPFVNPCNASQRIPSSIPQFLHHRPVLDWNHITVTTRTPTYGAQGQAQTANVGAAGSPVSGSQFAGNCSVGGVWYTSTNFPAAYQNTYFHGDWGQAVIKNMTFDANDNPLSVQGFASSAGSVVCIVQHPTDGSLYYVSYTYGDFGTVRRISYTGNRTPVAVASADKYYGPSPLTVQFSSVGSFDPDAGPLTYSWNFGDGSALSTQANPSHTFSAAGAASFNVSLTVSDSASLSAQTSLIVAANDTPPTVAINSPASGSIFSHTSPTPIALSATVSDAESSNGQLLYQWQVLLHHNEHNHVVALDTNHTASTVLTPIGCDGINIYYYRVLLTVTDPTGLATTKEVPVFPDCGPNTPPVISDIPNQSVFQDRSTAAIPFTIGDAQMAAINLQLSAVSSNPTLLPPAGIVFGGSESNRTVTFNPTSGQIGTATITVSVTDGPLNAVDTVVLTVNPPPAGTASFTNSVAIGIPDSGAATPYPSYLDVKGMGGSVNQVIARLHGLSHTWGSDIDALLVGPGGQKSILMADAGSGGVNNLTLTFSDAAVASLPANNLATGTFKPTNYDPPTDAFPAPAPAGPYGILLSAFNGATPNGAWSLYVFDDGPGDQGSVAGGWSLTITTSSGGAAPTIGVLADQSTAVNTPTTPAPFTIADTDTAAGSLTLSGTSSNPALVPDANITFGGSGNNRTVTVTPAPSQTGSATITVRVTDTTGNWSSSGFVVSVTGVNSAPTISDVADQSTSEDVATSALALTVGDNESPAANLILTGSSSNTGLVPDANIVFGGSGANRTVTVTPALNQSGSTTITIIVSDGGLTATDTFVLTVNPINDPPSISDIANQTTSAGVAVGPLSFTVGDPETAAGSLTLSKGSSNQGLVPDANIVFGGSGANRTVSVTPLVGQTGTATITVGVSDGVLTTNDTFVLTVLAANTPPSISDIADTSINEDANTGPIGFTVGDSETAPGSLSLSGSSSVPAIVPNANIVFGGSGANRTVTVTPLPNQNGPVTITINVSDGLATASDSFVLTVNPVNDVPSISNINDLSISLNSSTGPIGFTVGDVETAAGSLSVSGTSGNQALVPDGNINFGGSGSNRTVTVTPLAGQSGLATITVNVSDGTNSASDSFVLTVSALAAGSFAWTNATAINIPDQGNASVYPSSIVVSNVGGTVSNVTVVLRGFTHSWTRDADMLLVGPGGQKVMICSDAGNGQVNNITLTLSNGAANALPLTPLTTGTFRPADYETGDVLGAPAPAGPYTNVLTAFNGQAANGTWSLYVFDDGPGDVGTLAGGWSLGLTTFASGTPPTISNIADVGINEDSATSAIGFTVGDAETAAGSLILSGSSSAPALVPNANIVFGGSGANRTVTVTPLANQNGTATITVIVSDGALTATDTFVVTVNPVNDGPSISDIADQSTSAGVGVGPLAFTVSDLETAAGSLTLTKGSSNQGLVPDANIVFGGSGANRTVSVTPLVGQAGTATITVGVSDGALTTNDTFVLTVLAGNTSPTISDIADTSINEDANTGPIGFTVGDSETAPGSLSLSGSSSVPAIVPNANIVFGGSGANRTVTVTPLPNQNGPVTITINVSDGLATASDSFVLTVNPVNDVPSISNINDLSISLNSSTGPIGLSSTVGSEAWNSRDLKSRPH